MNKVSYALGLGIGRQLQDLCGEDLNLEDFAQAVKDIYTGGELAIDEIEGQQMVIEYLQRRDAEKKAEQAAAGEVAKKAGEDFLKENSKKAGVVTLPSGLQYMVIKEGTGRSPKATDNVKCHYEGTLIDGTLFDSSKKRGEPATFPFERRDKGLDGRCAAHERGRNLQILHSLRPGIRRKRRRKCNTSLCGTHIRCGTH